MRVFWADVYSLLCNTKDPFGPGRKRGGVSLQGGGASNLASKTTKILAS